MFETGHYSETKKIDSNNIDFIIELKNKIDNLTIENLELKKFITTNRNDLNLLVFKLQNFLHEKCQEFKYCSDYLILSDLLDRFKQDLKNLEVKIKELEANNE